MLEVLNKQMEETHAISSVMKAQSSWHAAKTIQECREILGGHGYSSYNRLGALYRDNDINATWEGDNTVLQQQTSKFLLDGVQKLLKGKDTKFESLKFLI